MAELFTVSFDLDRLKNDLAEVGLNVDNYVTQAVQAGAQVFYNEMKIKVGSMGQKTGSLYDSIYQWRNPTVLPGKAEYRISWRKGRGKIKGEKQGGLARAPHGQLIEYGWIQKYASYTDDQGQWHTAVRPEKRKRTVDGVTIAAAPKPGRNASVAEKDAYYLPRPGGAVQWLPRSFLRSTFESHRAKAEQAAIAEMNRLITQSLV